MNKIGESSHIPAVRAASVRHMKHRLMRPKSNVKKTGVFGMDSIGGTDPINIDQSSADRTAAFIFRSPVRAMRCGSCFQYCGLKSSSDR